MSFVIPELRIAAFGEVPRHVGAWYEMSERDHVLLEDVVRRILLSGPAS